MADGFVVEIVDVKVGVMGVYMCLLRFDGGFLSLIQNIYSFYQTRFNQKEESKPRSTTNISIHIQHKKTTT